MQLAMRIMQEKNGTIKGEGTWKEENGVKDSNMCRDI